jgi:hypothetical protein
MNRIRCRRRTNSLPIVGEHKFRSKRRQHASQAGWSVLRDVWLLGGALMPRIGEGFYFRSFSSLPASEKALKSDTSAKPA